MEPTAMANGHPPAPSKETTEAANTSTGPENKPSIEDGAERVDIPKPESEKPTPRKPKPKRPNYNQIHSKPLPLTIHPLPAFHPSNPISLLRLTYIYLTNLLSPPLSHPPKPYTGLFSPRTRSIHITDPESVRALWEMGFFGKGTLSRSEPSWLEREEARLRAEKEGDGGGGPGGGKAEDATRKRREERRAFKLERARVERERVLRQRAVEEGRVVEGEDEKADGVETQVANSGLDLKELPNGHVDEKALHEGRVPDAELVEPSKTIGTANGAAIEPSRPPETPAPPEETAKDDLKTSRNIENEILDPIENQEHLQLTLEEAFFLSYSLGLLEIYPPPPSLNPAPFHPGPQPYTTTDLLFLSCHHSAFPPVDSGSGIAPDDQFLLNYVAYHHFRSLGHAEFGVLILPSYTHRYWNTPGGRSRRRIHYPGETSGFSTLEEDGGSGSLGDGVGGGDGKDWWFLHCVNRVQSQVRKSLVLCYVDVPSPWEVGLDDEWDSEVDLGRLLRGFRVREFVVRRWVPNRSRD